MRKAVPRTLLCDNCGTPTPIYRLASVVLDGRIAQIDPKCAATLKDRIEIPYSPRVDQGAIQPSTSRAAW
jgi:hypothetical protein